MSSSLTIATMLHQLAAVIWVGGMFFSYRVLRPAAGDLETATAMRLWSRVFPRFFPWVWASVLVLPLTGYAMVFGTFGGFSGAGYHVLLMHGSGWLMVGLYVLLYFGPYAKFRKAVAAEDWPRAAIHLRRIRRIIAINLTIGVINVLVGGFGRFWP